MRVVFVVCLLSCFHSLFTYTVGGSRLIYYIWAFFFFFFGSWGREKKRKSSLLYHNLSNLSSFKTLVAGWPVCLQCFSSVPGLDRLACYASLLNALLALNVLPLDKLLTIMFATCILRSMTIPLPACGFHTLRRSDNRRLFDTQHLAALSAFARTYSVLDGMMGWGGR